MALAVHPRRGFSRLEVLVVLVIIALVVGILLPAGQKLREAAGITNSVNNLKQIGLASQNFHDTYMRLPGNGVNWSGGPQMVSPMAATSAPAHYQILSYIEQDALFRNPNVSARTVVGRYLEPVRARPGHIDGSPTTDYAFNALLITAAHSAADGTVTPTTVHMKDVGDGTRTTILAGGKALSSWDYDTATPNAVDNTFLDLRSAGGLVGVNGDGPTPVNAGTLTAANASAVLRGMNTVAAVPAKQTLAPVPYNLPAGPPVVPNLLPEGQQDTGSTRPVAGQVSDHFGGPYPGRVLFVFVDSHVQSLSLSWLRAQELWVQEATGSTMTNLRRILTPTGGEVFLLE